MSGRTYNLVFGLRTGEYLGAETIAVPKEQQTISGLTYSGL